MNSATRIEGDTGEGKRIETVSAVESVSDVEHSSPETQSSNNDDETISNNTNENDTQNENDHEHESQSNSTDESSWTETKEEKKLRPRAQRDAVQAKPVRRTLNTAETECICMNIYFIMNDMFLTMDQDQDLDAFVNTAKKSFSMYREISNLAVNLVEVFSIMDRLPLPVLKRVGLPCILRFFKWCGVRAQDPLFANSLVTNDKCFRFILDDIRIYHHEESAVASLIEPIKALAELQQRIFRCIDIVGTDSISIFPWEPVDVMKIKDRLYQANKKPFHSPKESSNNDPSTTVPQLTYNPGSPNALPGFSHASQQQQEQHIILNQHFQDGAGHTTSGTFGSPSQFFMDQDNVTLNHRVQELVMENQQLKEYVSYLNQNLQSLMENPDLLRRIDQTAEAKSNKDQFVGLKPQDPVFLSATSHPPQLLQKNFIMNSVNTVVNPMSQVVDNGSPYPFTFSPMNYSKTTQPSPDNHDTTKRDFSSLSGTAKQTLTLDPMALVQTGPSQPSMLDLTFANVHDPSDQSSHSHSRDSVRSASKRGKTAHTKDSEGSAVSKGKMFKPPVGPHGKNYLLTHDGNFNIVMKNDLDSVYSIYNEFVQSLKPQVSAFVEDFGRSRLARFQKKRTFQKRKAFCSFVESIANYTNQSVERILDMIDELRTQNDHSVIWVCNNLNQLKADLIKQRPNLAKYLSNEPF